MPSGTPLRELTTWGDVIMSTYRMSRHTHATWPPPTRELTQVGWEEGRQTPHSRLSAPRLCFLGFRVMTEEVRRVGFFVNAGGR